MFAPSDEPSTLWSSGCETEPNAPNTPQQTQFAEALQLQSALALHHKTEGTLTQS